MKLYFSPLACSVASRIALYEAGAPCQLEEVDGKTKRTSTGDDYRAIHPLGLVPALALDDGTLVTENAAVLQWIADRHPEARLAPSGGLERARLQEWLCFIGTELHKALYVPLLDKRAPEAVRAYAMAKAESRLGYVARALEHRTTLLDTFSVADAYLFAVLNWSVVTPIELADYPPLVTFMATMLERPHVARAFAEEKALYLAELARERSAASAT